MRHGQALRAARGVFGATGAAYPMSPSTHEELAEEVVVVEAPRNGGPRRGPQGMFRLVLRSLHRDFV